jgi:hypothetical protein
MAMFGPYRAPGSGSLMTWLLGFCLRQGSSALVVEVLLP